LGVFEFILVIVLITTIGKVLEARRAGSASSLPPPSPNIQHLEELLGDMDTRLARLEEERDFYRALLEAPADEPLRVPEPCSKRREHGDG
jgi:hypothetical protein